LSAEEHTRLSESLLFLRTLEHVIRLVSGRARKWLPVAEHPRRAVHKLLWGMLGADDSFDPEMRLAEVLRQTRDIYLKHAAVNGAQRTSGRRGGSTQGR
jgi:glutamine synthetase adenylyltransferase